MIKNLPAKAGDTRDVGSIPGSGRYPGEGIGNPLQYSDLENSMDCTVNGITKSQTQLSDFNFISLISDTKLKNGNLYKPLNFL